MKLDVAIIGGGPGGSTCGGFLSKYRPGLKVGIFEREHFPRDHVGESQLPIIGGILDELGVWDKVEAADFPVKIGGTYRWGKTDDLWDFHFLPNGDFKDEPRPAPYGGQRRLTALQVDRAVYDKILLDHARELGCQVYEGAAVREVLRDGDKTKGLRLADGTVVEARYYVDASGHVGILRRGMGIGIEEPSSLRNIAIWDYWQNAEWAVEIGVGGTRIQIMSLGYGWLWFIPLSPTRTSIGFVCPADYYKEQKLSPEALYLRALDEEPRIRALIANATREKKLASTKDWSFVAERMTGENWILVGESAGFADPILSAGLSLTHASAREAAFTLLEMDRGRGKKWLREQYEERNRRRILQHIRFADYWYTANAHFSELQAFVSEIAKDAGLDLDPERAFQWLGTGGFVEEDMGIGGVGTVSLTGLHQIARRFSDSRKSVSPLTGYSGFVLNLDGAKETVVAHYEAGEVQQVSAYTRGGKVLPLGGIFGLLVNAMRHSPRSEQILGFIKFQLERVGMQYDAVAHVQVLESLEAMARDGWIELRKYASSAPIVVDIPDDGQFIAPNRDRPIGTPS